MSLTVNKSYKKMTGELSDDFESINENLDAIDNDIYGIEDKIEKLEQKKQVQTDVLEENEASPAFLKNKDKLGGKTYVTLFEDANRYKKNSFGYISFLDSSYKPKKVGNKLTIMLTVFLSFPAYSSKFGVILKKNGEQVRISNNVTNVNSPHFDFFSNNSFGKYNAKDVLSPYTFTYQIIIESLDEINFNVILEQTGFHHLSSYRNYFSTNAAVNQIYDDAYENKSAATSTMLIIESEE